MRIIITAFFLLIIASACKEKEIIPKPENLLNEALYIDVFTEMELLKVYQNQKVPFAIIDSLYDEVLVKYDVDGEQFMEAHRYYQAQIEDQQRRVDTVIARLKKELNRIEEIQNRADSLDNE